MNTVKWILLCTVFTVYLLFGGSIIMVLEQGNEIKQNLQFNVLRKDIQEILFRLDRDFYHNGTSSDILDALTSAKENVLHRISEACGGKNLLAADENVEDKPLTWTFYNSLFFAFTAVTTIGYGNLTPVMPISRMFTILYALFGIPINGIIISGLSDYYSRRLIKAHKRSKDSQSMDARIIFIFDIIFYLVPGILVFVVAPAGFFVVVEKWSFLDSIYFCFVTLSTIGFGDYVAGMGDGHSILLWLYKAVIIIWIMFGLGYLLMILSFITKGMTSKQVRSVIERRLDGIKSTKEKLSKDIDYMRRVVQELYLIKGKPAAFPTETMVAESYVDNLRASESCHNIRFRRNVSFNLRDISGTKRPVPITFARSYSEGDLERIAAKAGPLVAVNQPGESGETWAISDELMENLMSVIAGNVNEMVQAVDDLNEYESKLNSSQFDQEQEGSSDNHTDNDVLNDWRLEQFDSDEEILIEEDEDESLNETNLEEVVVHFPEAKPETLIDKIGGAIRKISTGKRSQTSSRKVSRNDHEEKHSQAGAADLTRAIHARLSNPPRKISKEQKIYSDDAVILTNKTHRPYHHHHTPRVGSNHKSGVGEIAHTHKISSAGNARMLKNNSDSSFTGDQNVFHRKESGHMSGRISMEHSEDERRKISVERKSLQTLLQTLDAVQDRLHTGELSGRPSRWAAADASEANRLHRRKRKVGIFNPGFSFQDSESGKDADKHQGPGA